MVNPANPDLVLTGGRGPLSQTNWSFVVSYSTDAGGNWTRCNLSGTLSGFAHALAVAPSEANVIYAGGQVAGRSAVYYSTNYGASWTRTATSPGDTVFGLMVDAANASCAYAATGRGVYLTTNRGATWTALPSGNRRRSVVCHPEAADTLYCGGDSGVSVSRDRGQTWSSMNQGLPSPRVTCLASGPERLIAGTASGACFAWQLGAGIVGSPVSGTARSELVVQPNPSSGVLVVWAPQSVGRVIRVRVMDVSGREVLAFAPERSVFSIDGRSLGSGIYLVEAEGEWTKADARVVIAR